MTALYKDLASGDEISHALSSTESRMISANMRHPYYWAGFDIFATFTQSQSGGWTALMATFKAYSGGGGQPPAAPTNLLATAGNAQVALSWTASSGATSYNVDRSTTNGGPYSTIASPTNTIYTDNGVNNGTTHYYVVTTVNSPGQSDNSNQASATPAAGVGGPGVYYYFDDMLGTARVIANSSGTASVLFRGGTSGSLASETGIGQEKSKPLSANDATQPESGFLPPGDSSGARPAKPLDEGLQPRKSVSLDEINCNECGPFLLNDEYRVSGSVYRLNSGQRRVLVNAFRRGSKRLVVFATSGRNVMRSKHICQVQSQSLYGYHP